MMTKDEMTPENTHNRWDPLETPEPHPDDA